MRRLRKALRLIASSITPTSAGMKMRARRIWTANPKTAPAIRAPSRFEISDARRQTDIGPPSALTPKWNRFSGKKARQIQYAGACFIGKVRTPCRKHALASRACRMYAVGAADGSYGLRALNAAA